MEIEANVYLIFLTLALSYSLSLLLTLLKTREFSKFIPQFKSAKLLYYFLIVQQSFRVLSFWYFCIFSEKLDLRSSNLTFAFLTIPDSLLICSLIVLLWVIITANIYTRIEADEENLYIWSMPALYKVSLIILKSLLVWILFELILYGFLLADKVSRAFIVYQQCGWSVIASGIVIYTVVHLQVKYSGIPFKDSNESKVMKKVNNVSFIWSFGRVLHVILFIIREIALNDPDDLNELKDSTGFLIVAVCDFLITELVCYYLVENRQFFKTFYKRKTSEESIPLIDRAPRENIFIEIKDAETEEPNIVNNEEIPKKKGKLGVMFKGTFNEKPVMIRRIELKRVSTYVIEQIQQEVEKLRMMSNPYLLQYLKVVVKKPVLDLVMPLMSKSSLYEILHGKICEFSVKEKLKLAKDLAVSIKLIHSQNRAHGHLSSHNVFLDGKNLLVADLGFEHLKKYVGLLDGYCNKSGWSSPELLKDSGNVVIKPNYSDDSYSFGMILWEIMTEQEPFPEYGLKKLKELVVEQGFRPALDEVGHEGVKELIMICLSSIPENRPTFSLISSTLSSLYDG